VFVEAVVRSNLKFKNAEINTGPGENATLEDLI
jgi:hypothetical protein